MLSAKFDHLRPLTKLDSTHICSFMDPVRKTILSLDHKSPPNPLLAILKSTLEDPNPDWVKPLRE
jgi:hypothetical protein